MSKKTCPKCNAEITESKAKACESCGASLKAPIYKKWWFWVIIALGVLIIASTGSTEETNQDSSSPATSASSQISSVNNQNSKKTYEIVDLQKMLDDLNENALRAESTYQNKYVQVTGKIVNFDSDGAYISIEPKNASEWNFETVQCYIKTDSQRDFLMNKSKGDIVTIKGKITSIGEILGYSINIDEIS